MPSGQSSTSPICLAVSCSQYDSSSTSCDSSGIRRSAASISRCSRRWASTVLGPAPRSATESSPLSPVRPRERAVSSAHCRSTLRAMANIQVRTVAPSRKRTTPGITGVMKGT